MSDIKEIQKQLSELDSKVEGILSTLKEATEVRNITASIINNNFELLNSKIDTIGDTVNDLHKDTAQNFKEVKFELVKIQKVTGYDGQYLNLVPGGE